VVVWWHGGVVVPGFAAAAMRCLSLEARLFRAIDAAPAAVTDPVTNIQFTSYKHEYTVPPRLVICWCWSVHVAPVLDKCCGSAVPLVA
jgi:hypothetical protein